MSRSSETELDWSFLTSRSQIGMLAVWYPSMARKREGEEPSLSKDRKSCLKL